MHRALRPPPSRQSPCSCLRLWRPAGPRRAPSRRPPPPPRSPRPTSAPASTPSPTTPCRVAASGTPGNVKGTDWIAAEARRIGLEPAGEDGGWFQTVPILRRELDSATALTVEGQTFKAWTDMIPRDQGTGARSVDGARAIYAGTWGGTLITPEQARGQAGGGDVPPGGRRARGECQPGSDHPALQHRGRHRGGDARRGRSLGPDRSRGRGGAARPRQQRAATPLPKPPPSCTAPRASPRRCWAARWPACSPEPRVGRYRARSASWTHRPSIRRATWWRSSGAAIPRSAARWSRSAPTTITTGSSRRRWTTTRSAPSIA